MSPGARAGTTPPAVSPRARAEEIRRAELERFDRRWDRLSPADRERLEGLTRAIVERLLRGG